VKDGAMKRKYPSEGILCARTMERDNNVTIVTIANIFIYENVTIAE
jgi:hypothetical protein